MLPVGVARCLTRALALAVVLLPIASCGGEEGGGGARPTISSSRTPTASVPSPTRSFDRTESPEAPTPTRTEQPSEQPSEQPTEQPTEETQEPRPTRSADPSRSPDGPATAGSALPTEQEPSPETPTPTASGTEDAAEANADGDTGDEGVSAWVWWVLAALLLGAAVAVPLVLRARRRSAWDRALAEGEGEVAWLARELLPELRRGGSLEQVAGGWAVGRTRVTAAEDRLTVLESTAPDDVGRERARALREASRRAQAGMERLTGSGPHDTWALDLDAVIDDLEHVLRPSPDTSVPPPAPAG